MDIIAYSYIFMYTHSQQEIITYKYIIINSYKYIRYIFKFISEKTDLFSIPIEKHKCLLICYKKDRDKNQVFSI